MHEQRKVPSLGAQKQAKQVALFDVSMANKGSSASESLQTKRILSLFLPITHNKYNGRCLQTTHNRSWTVKQKIE